MINTYKSKGISVTLLMPVISTNLFISKLIYVFIGYHLFSLKRMFVAFNVFSKCKYSDMIYFNVFMIPLLKRKYINAHDS